MKLRKLHLLVALTVASSIASVRAATFTVTTTAADGAGSFSQAIRNADASADPTVLINFNIPGAGPHYISPPANGFPLVIKDNLTIDGYSQPGSSPNTAPITQSNNAVIKIVLDARAPNNNFRDMAYVFYGTLVTSDPVINNSSMAGSPNPYDNEERGGFTPNSDNPYVPGEVAILGVYRATNVTIKGLALLGNNDGTEYAIAVATDYGLDTAVKDRWTYDQGSSRGFHLAGCWIGTDPATGNKHLSGCAVAAFRHRDRGTGGTRPELPNMENMTIGVKNGAGDARAQFNVLESISGGLTIAGEGTRCKVSGNQFLGSLNPPEIGRYDDTQVPSIVYGTDGDGVNDAEEGNLFPSVGIAFYGTGNKVYAISGNIFGLERDGTRPAAITYALDEFRLDQRTKVYWGSNMDGRNDEVEGNTMYDTLGLSINAAAPDNQAWISFRGNKLVKNLTLPTDETTGLNLFNKFITAPFTPVITAVSTRTLTGTCGAPVAGVTQVVVDVYESDPEGDTAGNPQGKKYLGSLVDNGPADSNAAAGAFTFDVSALRLTLGSKVTINATYLKADGNGQSSPFATSATVTAGAGVFTVTSTAADGAGSFSQAIRNADASADPSPMIVFNIPGAGPHYISPPANGFPLVIKDNLTIDGYSQPGSSPNTAPITQSNNAVIKIVLDARAPNNNFRDMAYVFYGTLVTSDPVINNSSMAGSPNPYDNEERGGFTPNSDNPYVPGEVAILGVYRATNVTIKGLALLGNNDGTEYAIAVATDYGLDTAVKDRWTYDQGSSRGFHLAGCWIGTDPATGNKHLSGCAVAAFRHRDRGTGGTRPELPNMENMTIGVKNGAGDARAQFNVLESISGGLTIAGEGTRCKVSGNQFLGSLNPPEIGRYDDTQVPSIVYGTDGDGVNDAEEGNLFPSVGIAFYGTGNKVYAISGNIFGLERDGTRPAAITYALDEFRLDQRTKVRWGSDMGGLNDEVEGNTMYDTLGLSLNAAAPDNQAWFLMRGNKLVKNLTLPTDETTGLNLYNKHMNTAFTPVISAATITSLTGTCGTPLAGVDSVVIDVYESDPEGDTAGNPQGKRLLGSFTDNGPLDSNGASGAFTLNTSALGVHSGMKLTITANYLKASGAPTVTSVARSGGNTTLNIAGGNPPFNILRSSIVSGPYTSFASAAANPAVFADANPTSFYKLSHIAGGGQTSPFATSATVP